MKRDKIKRLRERALDLYWEAERYLREERAKGTPYKVYWPNYMEMYNESMRLSSIVRTHTER